MDTYFSYFDMLRYIAGLLLTILMLCHGILPEKPDYRLRLGLCFGAATAAALAYVPLSILLLRAGISLLPASVLYWIFMGTFPIIIIRLCWENCWTGVFFRGILCISAENFMTAAGYYLLSRTLFPGLFSHHPVLSSLLLAALYAAMLLTEWLQLRPRVSMDENDLYQNPKKPAAAYVWAYVC